MRFLLFVLVLLFFSLHPEAMKPTEGHLTIFFSGFVQGNYGPCGCEENPTGGLSRRAGYTKAYQTRTGHTVLHVDAGNYFSARGAHARWINEFMREGLERLPIRVLNLASEDLYLWPELSGSPPSRTSVISTNLIPLDSSAPRPEPFAVVTVPGEEAGLPEDLRIGFLGISAPDRVKPNSRFRGTDPARAVAEAIPSISDEVDFIVLLADIERDAEPLARDSLLYRIATSHPEILIVLSTEKQYRLHRPEQIGNAVLLSAVERGRYLGQLLLRLDSKGRVLSYEPEYVEMKEGVEEDPELLRMQEKLESRLFRGLSLRP